MSRKKELAKNTAILTFGKICTQCISFFMLPLYTAILDTSEYGTYDLLITYATLFLPLVNWQFEQGLFRFLVDQRNCVEVQKNVFSTVVVVNTIQSLVYFALLTVVGLFMHIEYIGFLILYVVLHTYMGTLLQFARGRGKNMIYAIGSFISAVSTVVCNVIMLVVLKWGLPGLFISTIMAQCFAIVYLLCASKAWEFFSIKCYKKELYRDIRDYALPLIPNNLAWWVVNASNRVVISEFMGVAANGIFTVANKFPHVFISFYNIVNLSWTETVVLHFNDDDRDSFLSEMMTTMYKLFASACFLVVAVMPFVYPWFIDEKYSDGYNQVLILMYAMLFRVLVGMYSCIYIATKQSKKVAITSISAAVISLVLDVCLINYIGLYAASVSNLIAFMIMFVLRYIDVNKIVHMVIDKQILSSSILIGCVLAFSYYSNIIWCQAIVLIFVVIYGVVINYDMIKNVFYLLKKRRKNIL